TQVTEPDFIQHVELVAKRFRLPDLSEELNRFADGHLQNVVDRFPIDLYPENVRLESAPFALRATHIKIAQELHFDLLEAGPATALAAAAAGIERKRARRQPLRHCLGLRREHFPNAIIEPQVKDRCRARGAGEL